MATINQFLRQKGANLIRLVGDLKVIKVKTLNNY